MKASERKTEIEKQIDTLVNDFTKETGLEIHYIDIQKSKNIGFTSKEEDSKSKIILKDR